VAPGATLAGVAGFDVTVTGVIAIGHILENESGRGPGGFETNAAEINADLVAEPEVNADQTAMPRH